MKRLLIVLSVVAVVLTVGGVWAFAAWAQGPATGTPTPTRPFVDEDGDGLCDVCGRAPGQGPVDEDGDGVCDLNATGQGCGMMRRAGANGFVDEDGDGACDTCGGQPGQGQSAGQGRGMMRRAQTAGQGRGWGMMNGSRGCGATAAPATAPTN